MAKRWVGCDVEEHYFGEDRKHAKKERKLATSKDRSKFKKTDLIKQKQRDDVFQERTSDDSSLRGRVLSIVPEGILVECEGNPIACTLRGLLKKAKSQFKNLVTVGDFVRFQKLTASEGIINQIEPRRSVLSRADNITRRKEQLIAANIDQVLITASVVEPPLKPALIDRYIIAAQKGKMTPIVIINKIDLLNAVESEGILHEKELFDEAIKAYASAGIQVIPVSASTGEGIDELKAAMKDKASVFSGQSGAGKSSLINMVTGLSLNVGDVVGRTKKGAHTTTTAKLVPLSFGGWCIDTPGIKSFGIWDLKKDEIEEYFSEIFEHGKGCRFPDCTHTHEAGCAVHLAVEKGQISLLRYESFYHADGDRFGEVPAPLT